MKKLLIGTGVSVDGYKKLIVSASWKVLSDKQIKNAIDNSMYITSAIIDNNVVGFARLVGDFSSHGLLCEVVVLPEFQGLGIGKKIVTNIIDRVYNDLDDNEQFLIELLPECGKRDFYIKCGFKYKPENMDGMYLWIKK